MNIHPIAHFRSPLRSKFGVPRQSGIVKDLMGEIVFAAEYADVEIVRGLEEFDYLWLIWGFSENVLTHKRSTVRPPRLGGNNRMGVFATRSSFRPNGLALSSVRIVGIEERANTLIIRVSGADLMDGTPIYDIKPYITFTDSHPNARSGFVDTEEWQRLNVVFDETIKENQDSSIEQRMPTAAEQSPSSKGQQMPTAADLETIAALLAEDPRPQYHDDPERIYGMPFGPWDVRFRVDGDTLTVVEIKRD